MPLIKHMLPFWITFRCRRLRWWPVVTRLSRELWLLAFCLALAAAQAAAGPKIIFLDVGQGDCILVQCPGGNANILIDCGSTKYHQTDGVKIKQFLAAKWNETTTVVVTHGDKDHYSILSAMLAENKGKEPNPRKIIVGGHINDYLQAHGKDEKSVDGRSFVELSKELNVRRRPDRKKVLDILDPANPPDQGAWLLPQNFTETGVKKIVSCADGAMSFKVLLANHSDETQWKSTIAHNVNARSIVLMMDYAPPSSSEKPSTPVRVYFMGDAEEETENHARSLLLSATAAPGATPMDIGEKGKRLRAPSASPEAAPSWATPPGTSSDDGTSGRQSKKGKTKTPEPPPEPKPLALRPKVCLPRKPSEPKPSTSGPKAPVAIDSGHVVLKVGHHGSENGTTGPWLSITKPETGIPDAVLFSAGGSTPHGHPRCVVLQNLQLDGPCNNREAADIACYTGKAAKVFYYRGTSKVTSAYSTHVAEKKGQHWILDLNTRNWTNFSSVDALKKHLETTK